MGAREEPLEFDWSDVIGKPDAAAAEQPDGGSRAPAVVQSGHVWLPEDDVRTLIAANVRLAARTRSAEDALSASRRHAQQATEQAHQLQAEAGELAIRRFLDDLAAAGFPSTLYSHFTPAFREYLTSKLGTLAESVNRILGQYHDLPAEAIAARDDRYAEHDAEHDEDAQADLFRRLLDGDDDAE